jgi:hypothetical protein
MRNLAARGLLAALPIVLLALPAYAEKPQVRSYAAGSPSGGIPQWNPGEKFVAVSSGTCSGSCPVYELYVFNDGRVIFVGKKDTGKLGVARKKISPEGYNELLRTIVRHQVLEKEIKRGTCLKGRPMLMVMGSTPDAQGMIAQSLNSGCEKQADMAREIEQQFISWTEVEPWLVAKN